MAIHHGSKDIWLGGEDMLEEGKWFWSETGAPVSGGYNDWAPGQPSNAGHGEDCMDFKISYNHWNDDSCDLKKAFICQKYLPTDIVG